MKICFCNHCNGRNVCADDSGKESDSNHQRCSICGRPIDQTIYDSAIDTRNFTLLFIDDEPGFLHIMEKTMGKDFNVRIAANGAEGIALAKETQPDLILLDVSLPDKDGYELCRSMKLDDATCHIPVMFVTSHNRDIEEQLGFDVGGMDYITKPISLQVLHARIALFLGIKQLTS